MAYNNLREFIERLEREGELVRVAAEVSPVEEIAELTDRTAKPPGGGKAIPLDRAGTDLPGVTNLMGPERRGGRARGREGTEMVRWLTWRGACGPRTAALHRHYHVPCSNTAIGHLVLRPDNGEGLDMTGSGTVA